MKKLLIILFLCCPLYAYSQGCSFEYSLGYGTYKLDDIKSLQHSMLSLYGLKETDCFPNYITQSVALGYIIERHHFGTNFSYLTTGGRLNRTDYSGSFTVDIIMNGYRLGAFYRYYFDTKLLPLKIYIQLSPGVLFSTVKMKQEVNVYSESAQETIKLKGVGIYAEPSIGATYRLTDWLHCSLGTGYEFDFLGTLKVSGQKTQIKAQWNGLRLYAGLIFMLPSKKNSSNE